MAYLSLDPQSKNAAPQTGTTSQRPGALEKSHEIRPSAFVEGQRGRAGGQLSVNSLTPWLPAACVGLASPHSVSAETPGAVEGQA